MGFSRQEYWSGVPLPSRTCHFVNLNLKIEILEPPKNEDVVRVNQRKVDSSASDLSNFLN